MSSRSGLPDTTTSAHMAAERQLSTLPPAQPSYILRGHASQIHSVRFVRQNSRLLTGDADGWVVYWKLETKRPLAVWKAHDGAILGTEEWGRDKIITHGRDNNLRIWQLRVSDETTFSTVLPAEDTATSRPQPWLLHTVPVNTLNFCAFSMCYERSTSTEMQDISDSTKATQDSILIATPATDDKKINVYRLPDEKLRYVVPRTSTGDTGMVMAVKLVHHPASDTILVLSGYEGGLTAVHQLPPGSNSSVTPAQLIYLSQPHTQPILSLDVSPNARTYYTSGADAIIAAHRVPELPSSAGRINITEAATSPPSSTSSPGILPEAQTTATPVQPQPSPIIPPPPPISFPKQATSTPTPHKPAGLSSLLSSTQPQPQTKYHPSRSPPQVKPVPPHRSTNTKHSGQQSLRVRSDDRLLVTGGWDTRVRIYSTKTLKEVGVLKWHKQGVYAVDFASVLAREDVDKGDEVGAGEVEKRETGLGKLQRQREKDVQTRHWVVAGGKDGKVSLWEVF